MIKCIDIYPLNSGCDYRYLINPCKSRPPLPRRTGRNLTLPSPVLLGGRKFTFELRPEEDLPGATGLCHFASGRIDILADQLPIETTDTVLHELFHAILYAQGREYAGKTEELYVRALATGLTSALHANPQFLKWLTSRFPSNAPEPPRPA